MKIKVDVNNVTIIEKSDIHKGEYNVNKCIFEFSSEYTKDLIYRAVFSCINGSYYQLILNNECNIPEEILKEKDVNIELGVYAYILNDDNELELRYSPKPTYFRVENGSYKDADKTEVPSPTDYEKFLNEFNRNATQKTNEYNKNADKRIEEINNKVSDIEKIEDNIEEIEKNVQVSEQKVKDSEISAQNSAKKASESESNIISIEKNINDLKKDIDNTKTQIDEKAKEVKNNSDIAIKQARIATQQATLSGQNANKTSADKEDISQMKVSIEASEDNIEEIEKNVQAIKDDIEAAKNETLEAKEEVENSLENERIISDKKYARAIDSDVINVDNFGQIECDDNGYMKNIEIESTLPEIAQDIREGYNKFNVDAIIENKYIYANNSDVDPYYGKLNDSTSSNTSDYIPIDENKNYLLTYDYDELLSNNERGYCFYDENKTAIIIDSIVNTLYSVTNKKATFIAPTSAKYLRFSYDKNCNNVQLIEGMEEKPYEEYGATPSLDFPSEFKNIKKDLIINNTQENIVYIDNELYVPGYTKTQSGITVSVQEDLGIKFSGTATENVNMQIIWRETGKKKIFAKNITGKIYSFITGNSISGARIVAHTVDGAYIPITNTGFNLTSDLFFDNVYAEVTAGNTVDCVIYPQLTYKEADKYIPYNGYKKEIVLPENKFLGNFNGYKNIIQNGKLYNNLKIYKVDSNTNFSINATDDNRVQFLTPVIDDLKPELGKNDILSNMAETSGSSSTKKIRFWISYEELGTTSENTNAEHIAALKNKLLNITGEFLYPVDNEEETELEEINLALYQGINNISIEDLKSNFKYNVSIEKYIEENNANERKISDSKYPKALKTKVTDVEQTQIYADNSEVENLVIKGAPLTQKTRKGYNLLSTENLQELNEKGITLTKENGIISINGQSTSANFIDDYFVGSSSSYEEFLSTGTYLISGITGEALSPNFGIIVVIKHVDENTTTIIQNSENKSFTVREGDTFRIFIRIPQNLQLSNVVIKPMIVSGTKNKDFEEYGASPSLDYPSEVEITKEQKISIFRKNILDTNDINKSSSGITTISKNDGGININGTSTSTFLTIKSIDLNVPIKEGTKLFMNYGKTEKLLKDNTDFSPYFWLVNKNGTLFKTLNRNNINNGYSVEQEIYRISFGIEALVVEKQYSEDIYIELEISDKQPTQFQKYEATDISIALENSAIGNDFDIVNKETNFQNKVIKEVIFTGDENWGMNYGVSMFGLEFNEIDFNTDNRTAFCNYFKFNEANVNIYNTLKDNEFSLQLSQGFKKIFFKSLKYTTKAEWKAKLKELYEAGKPVKIYYVSETVNKIPLSSEVKQELNKFKLYDDLNNIFIDNGTLSFKYNKSLLRAFEEQSELSASLLDRIQALEQAQVNQVGGN